MNEKLANLIINGRKTLNISQRELSRRTGIDNNTISQLEKGNRKKTNTLYLKKISTDFIIFKVFACAIFHISSLKVGLYVMVIKIWM